MFKNTDTARFYNASADKTQHWFKTEIQREPGIVETQIFWISTDSIDDLITYLVRYKTEYNKKNSEDTKREDDFFAAIDRIVEDDDDF